LLEGGRGTFGGRWRETFCGDSGREFLRYFAKKCGLVEWCVWRDIGVLVWCFCGEVVVECVANVVEKLSLLWTANVGHVFQLYFSEVRLFR
jgi:hypothetical protein